jgi:hypothetical protein
MLQDGKHVGVVSNVVEETVDEFLGDFRRGQRDRTLDGFAQLIAGHLRHQELRIVEGFWEAPELSALAKIVGTHGEHDIDGSERGRLDNFGLPGGVQQELDEGRGPDASFTSGLIAVAEQLFELIDQDEESLIRAKVVAGDIVEAAAAPGQSGFDFTACRRGHCEGLGKSRSQAVHGVETGTPDGGDHPARAGGTQVTALDGRDEAGANQGGLAASRCTHDGQESPIGEAPQEFFHLVIAAEEEFRLIGRKRAQPWKGLDDPGRLFHA